MTTDTESPELRAPKYALAWAALVCALAALTLAHPALSGGFLVNPHSDQYIAGYAFRDFAAQTLRTEGHFPLWNPYLFGGMPYVDAMHGDIFYPTFLLRMLLPTDLAMTWGMILHFWFAGVATYALLRAHKLSFQASLVGGLAYMLSGQVAGLVSPGHDGKLFITALFPLTLLVLRAGIRDGRRAAWGALALVIGLAILTPHPQLLQYLLLAAGAYALWLAYLEGGEGAPARPVATRRLGLALAAVVVGLSIGAIQFLPLRQYTPWSPRASGHDWATATSYSMPPEEMINWFLPQFSGILEQYWGRNGIHFHSEYLGLPVLLLAGAGVFVRNSAQRALKWFTIGLLGVSALWALGGYTPFYKLVAAVVPGTMYFRAPSTIMFETAFAFAVLAALGTEALLRVNVSKRFVAGAGVAVIVVTLLGASGGFTNAFSWLAPSDSRFDDNKPAVVLGAWRMGFFGALMVAAMAAAATNRLAPRLAAWTMALLVVADLWSVERDYWQFSPRASQIYATDAIIERIKHDSQPGRVMTIGDPGRQMTFRDPFLLGDGLMSNSVRLVTGYHGNEMGRYRDVDVYNQGMPGLIDRLVNSTAFSALTNLHWIYTNAADLAKQLPAKFTLVAGPVKNAVGTNIWLYRVAGENPFAWVVPAVMKVPDDVALANLYQTAFPVQSVALFDTGAKVQGQQLTAAPAPLPIHARTTRYAPGSIDIELDGAAPEKSALIVSENFYPGWTATVDGKPAVIGRADYTLIGVPLNAGARKIQLVFIDAAYARGKTVTLLALVLAAFATIACVVADRRGSARG